MSGGAWSDWIINENESTSDPQKFHAYRGRRVNGEWKYDYQYPSKQLFPGSQQALQYLRTQFPPQLLSRAHDSGKKTNRGNDELDDEDDDEEETAESRASTVQQPAHDITGQLQNLRLGQYGSSTGPRPTNNPFAKPQAAVSSSAGYNNPFAGSRNYPYGYSGHYQQRSATPHPGQSPYAGNYQPTYGGGTPAATRAGAYGAPYGNLAPPAGSGHPSAQSHALGYTHSQQYGGPLQNPRSIPRSATAQSGLSRQPLERSQPLPNLRNFKALKPRDYRKFFKAGRVFKAFWAPAHGQIPGSTNPFGEVLRYVVLRPHKRHSICLAIHTYHNQGTTARNARPRDHVVIYTGERPPPLVPGEDEGILKRPPVKVTVDPKGEELQSSSRLSLAKLYTIEHNISTSPLGKLSSRDVERVKQYCIEVQGLFGSADTTSQSLDDVEEDEEEEEDD